MLVSITLKVIYLNTITHVVSEFLFYGICEPEANYKWSRRILECMAIRSYLRTVDVWDYGRLVALGTTSGTPVTHFKEKLLSSLGERS